MVIEIGGGAIPRAGTAPDWIIRVFLRMARARPRAMRGAGKVFLAPLAWVHDIGGA
jgi:hypothetical protein